MREGGGTLTRLEKGGWYWSYRGWEYRGVDVVMESRV